MSDNKALIAKLNHHADLATGGKQRSSLFREAANALAQVEILEFNLDEARTACVTAENQRDQAEQRIANAKMAIMTWNINGATLNDLSRILSGTPTAEQEYAGE